MNKPRLRNGGEITGFTGYQVILPDRFTSKYEIEKGDTITLQINGSPIDFEVLEIVAYDTVFLRHTRGATALLPLETLKEILGQDGGYRAILIEAAGHTDTNDLISELRSALDTENFVSYMEIQTIFFVAAPKISMLPELDLWTFLAAGGLGIFITMIGSIVPIIKSRNMKLVEEIKVE